MPRRYSMAKRVKATDVTRRRIEAALMRLLSSQPYGVITIADIAREADVSPRTVQRQYRSKDGLLLSACFRGPFRQVTEDLQDLSAESPEDFIQSFVEVQFNFYDRHNWGYLALHSRAAEEPEVKYALAEAMELRKRLIEKSLARWPRVWAAGRESVTQAMLGLMSYRTWQGLTEFGGFSSAKAAALVTRLLSAHLLRAGEGGRKQRPA